MSLPVSIPAAVIETVLGQLVLFFLAGANGDPQAARQSALRCLAAYHPATEPELLLAAEIIGFGFHVRQSLYDAAELDRPINQVMRLRSGAASLGREAYRNLVKLEALQRAREQTQPQVVEAPRLAAPPEATPRPPVPEPVTERAAATDVAAKADAPSRGVVSRAPTHEHLSKEAIRGLRPAEQKRIYLERMTQNVRRRQAEQAALAAGYDAALGTPAG